VRALTIISMTVSRSPLGRSAQTCWLGTGRMVAPPSGTDSLEGGHQGFNGGDGQDSRFRARFGGEVGTGDGNVSDQTREDFDLAVADVSRESGDPRELEDPAEERMTGIGDGDLPLALLRDQRGITLGEVFPCHDSRSGSSWTSVRSIRNAPAPAPWAWRGPAER
jgi:hypothetical protein